MKVSEKGHIYHPDNRAAHKGDGVAEQTITFANHEAGSEHGGTTTQEVIRILLDRTRHCNNCMPHWVNEQVIYHLRSALVLHEMRALQRKFEKGDYNPEYMAVGPDGHFGMPPENKPDVLDTPNLEPARNEWERECNHPMKAKLALVG